MEVLKSCPSCDSSFEESLQVKDYSITQQKFQICLCDNCGLLFTNPRPSQSEIEPYYKSSNYISHANTNTSLKDRIYQVARKLALKRKFKIISQYDSSDKPNTLLDIGCGTGHFLQYIKQKGWQVQGVELDSKARESASYRVNQDIFSSLKSLDTGSQFTSITLWHVLEHLHDLKDSIQTIKNRLHTDGTLFIAVPNHSSYDSIHYENYWAAWDVPRHLYHFNRTSMSKLLESFGFSIVQRKGMILDSYYVSLLSENYRNNGFPYFKAFYQGLMSNLKARSTINYSSVLYIAKHS